VTAGKPDEAQRELLERYEADTELTIKTAMLTLAVTNFEKFEPFRIPGLDLVLVRRIAIKVVEFLETYGYELISGKLYDDLMHLPFSQGEPQTEIYRSMRAGVEAVNAVIEAHNQWVSTNRPRQYRR
jgi:hypothetical protein